MKKIAPPTRATMDRQRGYILLLVLIFIAILMGMGAHFFLRATDHTRESGSMRDMTESMLLAESAMNLVMGRYYVSTGGGDSDYMQSVNLTTNRDNRAGLAAIQADIAYAYYITNTDSAVSELDQVQPALLQMVANGEAANVAATPLAEPRLVTAAAAPLTRLRINDLFINAAFRPKLFALNPATGLLQERAAPSTWSSETATEKVAVWVELVLNPVDATIVDIFVEAVAEVDGVKSYVQRFLDQSQSTTNPEGIPLFTESSVGTARVSGVDP